MAPRWASSPNPHKAESMFGITLPVTTTREAAEVLLLLASEGLDNLGLFDRVYVSYKLCWDIIMDVTSIEEDVATLEPDQTIYLILLAAALNGEL